MENQSVKSEMTTPSCKLHPDKLKISHSFPSRSLGTSSGRANLDRPDRDCLMIQTTFLIAWIILVTIYFGISIVITSLLTKNSDLPHKVARAWARSILFASRIRVTVRGLSRIDPDKPYIYMPNHQSYYDIPVLLACLAVQFRWLAKVELFRIPIFGQAMKQAGYISIDRSNRQSAFKSLGKAAETIHNGASVLIFPEGTRSKDGSICSFKKGGFVLAVNSGVPVVPVIVHGTRKILPKNQLLIRPGKDVVLEIRTPVETSDYTLKTKNRLMEDVRQIICESFEKGS